MDRFATASEKDLDNLMHDKDSKNTHLSTENSWNVFTSYLRAKSLPIDVESISKVEMNDILRKFYVEVRKTTGDLYKKKSLTSLRFGIQRKVHELRQNFDIIKHPEFVSANEIFQAQCVF